MTRRHSNILVLMSLSVLLAISASSYACPMCKDSIPNSDTQQAGSLPSGFNNSVYLLLVGLITVAGATCGFIVKAVRDTGIRQGFEVKVPPDEKQ